MGQPRLKGVLRRSTPRRRCFARGIATLARSAGTVPGPAAPAAEAVLPGSRAPRCRAMGSQPPRSQPPRSRPPRSPAAGSASRAGSAAAGTASDDCPTPSHRRSSAGSPRLPQPPIRRRESARSAGLPPADPHARLGIPGAAPWRRVLRRFAHRRHRLCAPAGTGAGPSPSARRVPPRSCLPRSCLPTAGPLAAAPMPEAPMAEAPMAASPAEGPRSAGIPAPGIAAPCPVRPLPEWRRSTRGFSIARIGHAHADAADAVAGGAAAVLAQNGIEALPGCGGGGHRAGRGTR